MQNRTSQRIDWLPNVVGHDVAHRVFRPAIVRAAAVTIVSAEDDPGL